MVGERSFAVTDLLEGDACVDPGPLCGIEETDRGRGTPAVGIAVDFQ